VRRPLVLLGLQALAVLGILACVGVLAARFPARLDLTPDRRFTLSPHSAEVIARLHDAVRVTLFYSSQQSDLRQDMGELLGLYAAASPRIELRMLDLDRSPGAAEQLDVASYNVAVIESDGRREYVHLVNEDAVTAALLRVAGVPTTIAYFLQGHGELDPTDDSERAGATEAARVLAADGFAIRRLPGAASIPDDASLVVLAGPTRELGAAEVESLATWVQGGGRLLVLADPETPTSVRTLLARFGIELGADVVVDESSRLYGTDGLSAGVSYMNQALVEDPLAAQAMLPVAQSVRLVETDGVRADYLAMTGEATWADVDRRDPAGGPQAFREGRDRRGPLPVGALARVGDGERQGRVVVIGDADFASNVYLSLLGNRDLLVTSAELAARDEVVAAARRRPTPRGTLSPLQLTQAESRLVFWGTVVAPAFLLAATALVVRRRRGGA
jgi:ABC-type uncharacterized transport system involved in gliding motility auxiliary subunit